MTKEIDWFEKPKSGEIKGIVDRAVRRAKTEDKKVGSKLDFKGD